MTLGAVGAVVVIAIVLFAAPLVLGAYVVLQRASWVVAKLYFGLLSLLLGFALLAGLMGLFVLPR
jgi:hypothetical protein